MIQVGRLVVKIAGRDARAVGVVVEAPKDGKVLIDGQMRRRAVNPAHIEPLAKTVNISAGASHEDVVAALKDAGYETTEKKNSHGSATRQVPKRAGTPKDASAKKK